MNTQNTLDLVAKIRQRWPDRILQREAIRKVIRELRELIHSNARQYILARIREETSGCWTWSGSISGKGYGKASFDGRTWRAHRLSFLAFKGRPTPFLVIDHLCRNRACCNPGHLECVTNRINLLRGISANARKACCAQGHSYECYGERLDNGSRWCRECQRIRDAKRYLAQKPKQLIRMRRIRAKRKLLKKIHGSPSTF